MIHNMAETEDTLAALGQAAKEAAENPNVLLDMAEGWIPHIVSFGIRVLLVFLIFFIGRKVIRFLLKVIDRSLEKVGTEITVRKFLRYLAKTAGYCILIVIMFMVAGKDATSFATLFSSVGIALGLALQGSLSNFAGGILILVFKPFKVGDYIVEDSHGNEGIVQSIGLVYTELCTADSKTVMIPNGALANTSVTNVTGQLKRRVDVKVGISYGADLKKAKETAHQILSDNELFLPDEEKIVFVQELGDSAVVLNLRGWVKASDYWNGLWSLTEEVKLAFDREGIEIPYNQLDVHMR